MDWFGRCCAQFVCLFSHFLIIFSDALDNIHILRTSWPCKSSCILLQNMFIISNALMIYLRQEACAKHYGHKRAI